MLAGSNWMMRRKGHIACMEQKRNAYRGLMGTPEETDCLEY
jgi:hypothetical protein